MKTMKWIGLAVLVFSAAVGLSACTTMQTMPPDLQKALLGTIFFGG